MKKLSMRCASILKSERVYPYESLSCDQDIRYTVQWVPFSLPDRSFIGFKGAVIQHISVAFELFGQSRPDLGRDFYEAWRYFYGVWADGQGFDDFLLLKRTLKGANGDTPTNGKMIITAYARFIEDFDEVVSGWGRIQAWAGELPATKSKPGGWTEGGVLHEWTVEWKCLFRDSVVVTKQKP